MKIILLNGPPSSGKDSAAKYLFEEYSDIVFERFSAPLKSAFAAITGKHINEYFEVDYYEEHKEEIIPWFGVSYRQWQIDFSEKFMKPNYGKEIFGKLFVERYNNLKENHLELDYTVVVPDSGFQIEIDVLEKTVDPKDVLLIRLHRDGYDFSKDSREYVHSDKFLSLDIKNNDLDNYLTEIDRTFHLFLSSDIASLEKTKA